MIIKLFPGGTGRNNFIASAFIKMITGWNMLMGCIRAYLDQGLALEAISPSVCGSGASQSVSIKRVKIFVLQSPVTKLDDSSLSCKSNWQIWHPIRIQYTQYSINIQKLIEWIVTQYVAMNTKTELNITTKGGGSIRDSYLEMALLERAGGAYNQYKCCVVCRSGVDHCYPPLTTPSTHHSIVCNNWHNNSIFSTSY